MPSPTTNGTPRGFLIPIGGAEAKTGNTAILQRFVALSGGAEARIAVLPTASQLPDTGDRYAALFTSLGAAHIDVLAVNDRADARREDFVQAARDATGIFITGGNQLRLSTILGGTPLAQTVRRRSAAGVPVAGTSAGAAIMPEHMISGGGSGATPTATGVILSPGLGLTNSLIVDQHFRQRDRLGRLLAAVAFNPFAVGVGLDEDTALFLGPDGVFEVVGSGAVTIVDPTGLSYSSMDSATPGEPVSLIGLTVHVLANGGRYDTLLREASPPARVAVHDDDEVEENARV
jgi:cyanophycinase